ncbi:MAG TPA: hemolysin family protein [Candidatus Binataceae bacterium]|nr:hemolysin family protein [Candidatus Binataceae bacterium]
MNLVGLILAIAACIALQAFFAASEIALVSADQLKVRAEGEGGGSRARTLGWLLERRDRLLALTLTTNNLATVVAAVTLTAFLHDLKPQLAFWAPFILAPLTLVLGESIPKLLTLRNPLRFARIAARPLRILATVLAPLLFVETLLSRALRLIAGVPSEAESVFMEREDLVRLLHRRPADGAAAANHDAILPAEQQMISRIFRFSRAEARKVMVPLVRVDAVPQDATLANAIEAVRRVGFSRLPVFRGRITDIVGVVHVFDLLEAPDLSHPVADVMRPVSYFPESMPLDEILVALQRTGENLAVIVDEYGGAAGIITVEDLLEEVVGEIEDEHDREEDIARVVNPRTLTVSARAPIAELNERFGLGLPEGDEYATIGGFVLERLGHIPQPGEQLKAGELTITVTRSDVRAVRELSLHLERPLRAEILKRRR